MGRSNKLLLDDPLLAEMLVEEATERVLRMLHCEGVLELAGDKLVELGICDPVRLFIKTEPHKMSKIREGKLRLIQGLSIVDQMIDRLIFGAQNELEISMWSDIPSKPGIGLDDEGLQKMSRWFRSVLESGCLVASDVSGWDWSVQADELDADLEIRTHLCDGFGSLWEQLAKIRVLCIKRKTFLFPDGRLVTQVDEGIMASGWYNTSSSNSRMRVYVRALAYSIWCERNGVAFNPAEVKMCAAMGDDCVERGLDGAVYGILEELGHTIKEVTRMETLEGVEFCSHRWYADGLARPVNWVKTLFRFANHPNDIDQWPGWLTQLMADFRHMRGVGESEIREVIASCCGTACKISY